MTAWHSDPGLVSAVLEWVGDGVLEVDSSLTVRSSNAAAGRLLGTSRPLVGCGLDGLLRDSSRLAALRGQPRTDWLSLVVAPSRTTDTLLAVVHSSPDGGGDLLMVLRPLLGGRADAMIAFATRDPVSRLFNREAFRVRLAQGLAAAADGGEVGLACIDLDRFQVVNEVLGHDGGDDVLRVVARRLREAAPADAVLARVGGDRFAMMLPGPGIAAAAHELRRALAEPLDFEGFVRPVTASIGVASGPADGAEADELIAAAESALQAIKAEGGDEVRAFVPADLEEVRRELALESALRHAIDGGQLSLRFQPKVAWPSRRLLGFEALVRWERPGEGCVLPGRFIGVAERSGLIVPLGRWVLAETCRQLDAWRRRGVALVPVAVNVSPRQLLSDSLDVLLEPIRRHHIPAGLIEIEITETDLMDNLCQARAVLDQLRAAGIRVAIDDFGTGHSSLGNLRRLPIHTFKIDRSFVDDIGTCQDARDIVATVIAMAHTLSLEVVAEGVETVEQAEFLHRKGAEAMQGYLFSPPVTVAEAEIWLAGSCPGHDEIL